MEEESEVSVFGEGEGEGIFEVGIAKVTIFPFRSLISYPFSN